MGRDIYAGTPNIIVFFRHNVTNLSTSHTVWQDKHLIVLLSLHNSFCNASSELFSAGHYAGLGLPSSLFSHKGWERTYWYMSL